MYVKRRSKNNFQTLIRPKLRDDDDGGGGVWRLIVRK